MSDIEKRKELSEEERLEKGWAEEEKGKKNHEAAEKGSSQSADQGSVTKKNQKSGDETQEVSSDSEKSRPDQEEPHSLRDSPAKDADPEEDNRAAIHHGADTQSTQNTRSQSDTDSEGVSEKSESEGSKEDSVKDNTDLKEQTGEPEEKIPESDLKTTIAEIEGAEKESASVDQAEKREAMEEQLSPEEDNGGNENDQPALKSLDDEDQPDSETIFDNQPGQPGEKQEDKDQSVSETSTVTDQPSPEAAVYKDLQLMSEALVDKEEEQPVEERDDKDQPKEITTDEDLTTPEATGDKSQPTPEATVDKGEEPAEKGEEEEYDEEVEDEEVEDEEVEDEEVEEEKDYSTFNKDQIVHEMEEVLKADDMKKVERLIKKLKPFYDEIFEHEQKESLQKFLDEGGAEVDFEYAGDALDSRFATFYEKYKTRRNHYYANLDKEKDNNLQKKHEVLEKLRSLVDGEETTTSIGALKEIQNEWKEIGPVPNQYAKSLWATYNILIDRFYDNRSIYFELKELDRRKNLEGKLELCERAEELAGSHNIKEAVKELNELHEEFKHIGPVPKEVQEEVWQRFKAASDAIYARRKEFVGRLKKDLNENMKLKLYLVEEVGQFKDFDSDKISEWNEKTKLILDIQKKWENIGGLPREHAKEVNKSFWTNFKSFFNNKNKFFKKLEGQRDENLKLKEELVERAEVLRESEDWDQTAENLKELQQEWKNIGPVPEKYRNDVYKRFKAACDIFFDRRRSHSKDVEGDYRDNLKNKEKICEEIENMVEKGNLDTERFKKLQLEFDKIGYVPRNAIRKIQKKYEIVVNRFLETVDLPGAEKSELKFAAEINRLKSSPNSDQKIQRKESELRRMISKLENDIALWRNNLEFFAESKTANKLREEFSKKIEEASAQLNELKEELKVLNKID